MNAIFQGRKRVFTQREYYLSGSQTKLLWHFLNLFWIASLDIHNAPLIKDLCVKLIVRHAPSANVRMVLNQGEASTKKAEPQSRGTLISLEMESPETSWPSMQSNAKFSRHHGPTPRMSTGWEPPGWTAALTKKAWRFWWAANSI